MPLTSACAIQLAQNLTGQNGVAPSQWCYVGLGNLGVNIGDNLFIEPTATEYCRIAVSHNPATGIIQMISLMESYYDSTLSAGVGTNAQIIFFNEALSDWGAFTHFGLFDAEDATEPYLYGELDSSVTINEGYIPIFRTGALKVIMYTQESEA